MHQPQNERRIPTAEEILSGKPVNCLTCPNRCFVLSNDSIMDASQLVLDPGEYNDLCNNNRRPPLHCVLEQITEVLIEAGRIDE